MEEGGISELPQYSGDLRKGEASFWKRGGGGGGAGFFPNITNLFEPSELPESHQNKKET